MEEADLDETNDKTEDSAEPFDLAKFIGGELPDERFELFKVKLSDAFFDDTANIEMFFGFGSDFGFEVNRFIFEFFGSDFVELGEQTIADHGPDKRNFFQARAEAIPYKILNCFIEEWIEVDAFDFCLEGMLAQELVRNEGGGLFGEFMLTPRDEPLEFDSTKMNGCSRMEQHVNGESVGDPPDECADQRKRDDIGKRHR